MSNEESTTLKNILSAGKTPLSKVDFYNLHFHHAVADLCEETEKAADGRVTQIVVAQHIAAAGDLQAAVPRRKLAFRVRNSKICAHVLDFRALEPGFGNHLYRRSTSTPPGKASAIRCTRALTCSVKK